VRHKPIPKLWLGLRLSIIHQVCRTATFDAHRITTVLVSGLIQEFEDVRLRVVLRYDMIQQHITAKTRVSV